MPERRRSLTTSVLGVLLLVCIVPGGVFFVRSTLYRPGPPTTPQVQEPAPDPSPLSPTAAAAADAFGPYQGAVPVLTYHGVGDGNSKYSLTVDQFAAQMAALDRAGFHTVTLQQVEDLATGHAVDLPPNPLLLTFDDGIAGQWERADPILAQHGFVATAFVVPSVVSDVPASYYLTWASLRAMLASGRWSVASHSSAGHQMVPIGDGDTGPFLSSLEVSDDGTVEPIEAWHDRVEADLRSSREMLDAKLGTTVDALAYPFSAAGKPSNDQRIYDGLPKIVGEQFRVAFLNTDPAYAVEPGMDLQRLHRLASVTNDVTPEVLLQRLDRSVPRPPPAQPGTLTWTSTSGAPCPSDGASVLVSGTAFTRCTPTVGNTGHWRDYTFSTTVTGADRNATAVIATRVELGEGLEVAIGESQAVVRVGVGGTWTSLATMSFPTAEQSRQVSVTLGGTQATVRISGTAPVTVPLPAEVDRGTISLGLAPNGQRSVLFSSLTIGP